MKKNIIQKPIVLLGPSGVGKSLISRDLSKETGLPIVCIDDEFKRLQDETSPHFGGYSVHKILLVFSILFLPSYHLGNLAFSH